MIQNSLFIIYLFIFTFGAIIGSFINCLVWRLHKNETMLGRSYCPKCLQKIFWHDNIPILSFLMLGGKCRKCKKKISWQYPVVELITGILFTLSFHFNLEKIDFYYLKDVLLLARDWFFISIMVIIFIYDLRWYLILDKVTLPACVLLLVVNIILGYSWQGLLLSSLIGASFFLIQFVVSSGRWIGGGDIRLGLLMGIFFASFDHLLLAIILGYFIGSIIGVGLISFGKKKWGSKLPLGVFLTTSSVIAMFWGEKILDWYLGMF